MLEGEKDVLRGKAAAVWVPVRVESTASIRFAGSSTFSMAYSYEMVNGVAVGR